MYEIKTFGKIMGGGFALVKAGEVVVITTKPALVLGDASKIAPMSWSINPNTEGSVTFNVGTDTLRVVWKKEGRMTIFTDNKGCTLSINSKGKVKEN